jgi:hypothetical protein
VLAGHSNGGLFARLYATTHPAQVKGLVLIDTGNYPAMLNALYRKMMPPSQWQAYRATLRHQPPFVANPAAEQVDLATSYRELAGAQRRHSLTKMPFVVISRGIPDASMGIAVVPGIDKAIETKWQQEQIKLAHLVPGGKRIVATQSDHMIPTGQPGLVVRTIRAVLAQPAGGTRGRHVDRPASVPARIDTGLGKPFLRRTTIRPPLYRGCPSAKRSHAGPQPASIRTFHPWLRVQWLSWPGVMPRSGVRGIAGANRVDHGQPRTLAMTSRASETPRTLSQRSSEGGDTDTLSDADLASLTPIREVTAQRFNHSPVTNASRGQRLVHPSITRHPGATAAQG